MDQVMPGARPTTEAGRPASPPAGSIGASANPQGDRPRDPPPGHARIGDQLLHAGAGSTMGLLMLSVMIPGLLPCLALAGVLATVLVLPLLGIGLVLTIAVAPVIALRSVRGRDR